ncbi:MAG: restriction endonuclease subunit S [Gammaproteobacteria bacterium]|nr:restriction endonuclease subunit S [Gammaproteobacteria bacterium]
MTPTIPVGPEARRLRFIFETKSGATPSSGVEEYWDGDINWVTPEDLGKLGDRYVRETRRRITEEGYRNSAVSLALPGSIVLSKRAPIGQTAILAEPSTCNQGCFLLTRVNRVDERFYYYALIHLRPALEALGRGSTFMELSADDLRSVPMPFPSQVDQQLIADYLDRELARIDGLISEKERMLALLEEKRAALISRTVTRGLDPKVPLKPSGQDWLGEIPVHWEVRTLKRSSSRIDTGTTPSASFMDGSLPSDFTWFTPSDFKHGGVITESNRKIPQQAVDEGEAKVFPAHSLMVIGIGATLGKVASSIAEFSANQQINVITPSDSIRWDYLLYVLQGYENVFSAHANSATLPILNQERLGFIRVPVPPPAEQDAIVRKLNESRAAYTEVYRSLGDSTSLLKERRAALISAAVTGQIPREEITG